MTPLQHHGRTRRRQQTVCLLFLSLGSVTSFCGPRVRPALRLLSHQEPTIRRDPLAPTPTKSSLSVAASKDISTTDNNKRKATAAKESFISQIEASLQDGTFVSLTLRGPSKKKRIEDELLRGRFKQIQFRRIQIRGNEFLQVTFKYHLATDICKNWPVEQQQHAKLVESLWQILAPSEDDHASDDAYIPASEWGRIKGADCDANRLGIQSASLTTTQHQWDLDVGYHTKKPRVKRSKVKTTTSSTPATTLTHDRVKQVPLVTQATFLQALGVTDHQGKPRRAMASKLRQCQKFVEIVGNLVERCRASTSGANAISVVDMGCGRGYLTFSLHSYLQRKYDKVQSVGIDIRPKLVQEINGIAQSLGNDFENLTFQEGSIEDVMLGKAQEEKTMSDSSLEILIALHACDTATDDALWCGISRQADIIVVAPCCHKQVRPQLNAHLQQSGVSHPLQDVLRHNVYRERHAEMATDSLRALLLELAGYQVQVFEFIGGEHTAKNVQITAVRTGSAAPDKETIRSRVRELACLHGIRQQKLAQWMGESLDDSVARINPKGMPPL